MVGGVLLLLAAVALGLPAIALIVAYRAKQAARSALSIASEANRRFYDLHQRLLLVEAGKRAETEPKRMPGPTRLHASEPLAEPTEPPGADPMATDYRSPPKRDRVPAGPTVFSAKYRRCPPKRCQ